MIAGETVNFVMRHPPGHELAGAPIEREQACSRCGRKFMQQRIDRDYLNAFYQHSRSQLNAFLTACQVEGKEVYLPARCPKCTRSQLNPDPEYAPMV